MKKLIFSLCLSFVAVATFAQDKEQEKEIVTTDLEEVVVSSGVIDVAKERQTPVALSTVSAELISDRVGNQEFRKS